MVLKNKNSPSGALTLLNRQFQKKLDITALPSCVIIRLFFRARQLPGPRVGQGLPPRAIAEVESSCATCRPSCQPLVRCREEQLVNIPVAVRVTPGIQLLLRQPQLLQLPRDTCTTSRQWPIPTVEGRAQVNFFLRVFFCYITSSQYRAPTHFRPLRHIFVHFCGLPTAFMLRHGQHCQVISK